MIFFNRIVCIIQSFHEGISNAIFNWVMGLFRRRQPEHEFMSVISPCLLCLRGEITKDGKFVCRYGAKQRKKELGDDGVCSGFLPSGD